MRTNAGKKRVSAGPGSDVLQIAPRTVAHGAKGRDLLSFEPFFRFTSQGVTADLDTGRGPSVTFAGFEDLTGTEGADELYGSAIDNHIRGLGDDDVLDGRDGQDFLDGGDGVDDCRNGESTVNCE